MKNMRAREWQTNDLQGKSKETTTTAFRFCT
jgi:hypothetical protein